MEQRSEKPALFTRSSQVDTPREKILEFREGREAGQGQAEWSTRKAGSRSFCWGTPAGRGFSPSPLVVFTLQSTLAKVLSGSGEKLNEISFTAEITSV